MQVGFYKIKKVMIFKNHHLFYHSYSIPAGGFLFFDEKKQKSSQNNAHHRAAPAPTYFAISIPAYTCTRRMLTFFDWLFVFYKSVFTSLAMAFNSARTFREQPFVDLMAKCPSRKVISTFFMIFESGK